MADKLQNRELSLDEYTKVLAHVAYFRSLDRQPDVLAALGVQRSEYEVAVETWTQALVADVKAQRDETIEAYADGYDQSFRALNARSPTIEELQPLRSSASSLQPNPATVHDDPLAPNEPEHCIVAAPSPEVVTPSYLRDEGKPSASLKMPSFLIATRPPHEPSSNTSSVAPSPRPIIAPPAPVKVSPARDLQPASSTDASDETLPPGSRPARSAALPFGDTPSPSFLAAVAAPHPVAPRDDAGETMFLAVVPDGSAALPFAKDPDPPLPRLTLEQYASLLVDLARAPAQRAAIMAQYGIMDEAMMHRLQLLWKTRGELDPMFSAKLEAAKAGYARWLAGRR